MQVTPLYDAIMNCDKEVICLQGGTWSAKTYTTLQTLLERSTTEEKKIITIAGQDMPNLKVGPIRQIEQIIADNIAFKNQLKKHNKSEFTYLFKTDSIIEFKSYENFQDAKSGKRDYLFINEGNGFAYEVAKQLMLRTSIQSFVDFNPDAEFWLHEHYKGNPKAQWFYSDHRHNPFVPQKIRDEIEALKDVDYELWKVYARGMTGKIEGLIYRNWDIVDEFPEDSFIDKCYGLDFGYNHPTALVEVGWTETATYWRELIYESKLTTADLITRMRALNLAKSKQIWADAARPDTIEELSQAGFNIKPADKSVKDGINSVKSKPLKLYRSPGLVKEIRAYKWKTDKNGKPVDEPIKINDDGMDAGRYATYNGMNKPKLTYSFG